MQNSVTANQDTKQQAPQWQAPFYQDHVLVGKIWDTFKQTWVTEEKLHKELLHYDYILLGEAHTNPDHHRLQAKVIHALVQAGQTPTLVMEMLSLGAWQDQPTKWGDLQKLEHKAQELNKGWPWELYRPILKAVIEHELDLSPGNISSDELQRWANQQTSDRSELIQAYAFSEDNFALLKKNIIASHCGHANEGFVNFMSRAQMHRDHVMAASLINNKTPVVFIAGKGHIRNDYAVPMQLLKKFERSNFISVAFIAVQEQYQAPEDYLQGVKNLYDILVFTPSHTNEDPCVKFREQLQKMQHRQTP